MKVRVLRVFKDKHKNCRYSVNQIIEVSPKRYEEINSTSFGLLVEEIEEDVMEESNHGVNFEDMTKAQLIDYCNKNNIQGVNRMKKDEIILKIKGE